MNKIRQLFAPDLSRMSEFRRREYEKKDPFWLTMFKLAIAFTFGWIPAFLVLFPFGLLFIWLIRKTSGY